MTYPMQPLSALGNIQTGSTPSTSEDKFWGGDYPFVTPAELDQSLPITTTPRTLSDDGAAESRILQQGAVMVCCIGSLGKIAIAGRSVVTNQQINSIEFDTTKVLPRYGYYACQRLKPKLLSMAPATTIPIVSKSKFGQLEIPVPPLPEQRRIAAILDQADALRTKRREALAQLDNLTQSIFIEMFGDPANNPKGWKLSSLPEVTEFQEGPGILAKDFRESGVPLVRLAGVGGSEASLQGCNFVSPEMFAKKWAHFALNEGEILVLTSATFGNPTVVGKEAAGAIFYTGIIRFRPKDGALDSIYLRHFLASSWFLRQAKALASGAVIKHFGPTHLKQMTIPVPTVPVQQHFAERVAGVERLRVPVVQALAESEKLFASLQHRAFRGEL